ncbi:MAG: AAA family ATPase [Candidatus Helarchaeota archaeon]|nr:AAA family ATPase [Candidatus Helarchaeota archaeon]
MAIEPFTMAITGKGGVGKTTFTAFLIKFLLNYAHKKTLVIDADPATNLADVLGISLLTTVGQIIDKTKQYAEKKSAMFNAGAFLEYQLWDEALLENSDFDFLAMGFTSGRGCYCLINEVLTYMLENLKSYFELVILDMDAGLEHISRNTKRSINLTFLVTDPSRMGFQTVRRIVELAHDLQSPIDQFVLIGNMFSNVQSQESLIKLAQDLRIEFLGTIPFDETIARMNLQGKPLLDIPQSSSTYQKIVQFLNPLIKKRRIL